MYSGVFAGYFINQVRFNLKASLDIFGGCLNISSKNVCAVFSAFFAGLQKCTEYIQCHMSEFIQCMPMGWIYPEAGTEFVQDPVSEYMQCCWLDISRRAY